MNFSLLKEAVDSHCNDIRRLQYIIDSPGFEETLKRQPNSVVRLCKIIQSNLDNPRLRVDSLEELRGMIRKENKADESLEDLRRAASILGVERYTRMDKGTLLAKVTARRQRDSGNFGPSDGYPNDITEVRSDSNSDSVQKDKTGESDRGST